MNTTWSTQISHTKKFAFDTEYVKTEQYKYGKLTIGFIPVDNIYKSFKEPVAWCNEDIIFLHDKKEQFRAYWVSNLKLEPFIRNGTIFNQKEFDDWLFIHLL